MVYMYQVQYYRNHKKRDVWLFRQLSYNLFRGNAFVGLCILFIKIVISYNVHKEQQTSYIKIQPKSID